MNTAPPSQHFWNVPNTLTLSRLVLAVGVFALIDFRYYLAALGLFVAASITDALDGYFARLLNQSSALGRQLDPLVDKLVMSGVLVYLVAVPDSGLAPWMVTVIVCRELLVQGLRSAIEGKGIAFGAKWSGKVKTTLQMLAVCAVLVVLGIEATMPLRIVRDVLIWSAVGMTVYSGVSYVALAWPNLKRVAEGT
jgi:CDP-diacylglycerol--glycerol-3-phosphate 3-phosphatidyltransferase